MKSLLKRLIVTDDIEYTSTNNPNVTIVIALTNVKRQTYAFELDNPKSIEARHPLHLYCGCDFDSIEKLKQKVEELLK